MKNTFKVALGLGTALLASSEIGCTSKQFYEGTPKGDVSGTNTANDGGTTTNGGGDGGTTNIVPVSGTPLTEEFDDLSSTQQTQVPQHLQLLFMIDNSGSMGDNQTKLASEFQHFADQHLTSSKNLDIARIVSDTYKAGASDSSCSSYPDACDLNSAKLSVGWADGTLPRISGSTRSGRPILKTQEVPADFTGNWISQIKLDFITNLMVGVNGHSSERGMQSVKRFIDVNEKGSSCTGRAANANQCLFTDPTAIYGIVMFSDELDSSTYSGQPNGGITNTAVVDYVTSSYKTYFDNFFKGIRNSSDPKYFASVIVDQQDAGSRKAYNKFSDIVKEDANNSAGIHSIKEDINSNNFTDVLNGIATVINSTNTVTATSFTLSSVPNSISNVAVKVITNSGSSIVIPANQGKYLLENSNIIKLTFDVLAVYPDAQKITISYIPQ